MASLVERRGRDREAFPEVETLTRAAAPDPSPTADSFRRAAPLSSTASRRADLVLVEAGLFESRAKASAAIAAGLVTADGAVVTKPSSPIRPGAAIEARAPHPYVSRGGVKLAAGLDAFGIDPTGRICLDVGASTGGFTDVLLRRGAARVLAVDVGRDQLHPRLKADPRVESREGTDIRDLAAAGVRGPFDIIVCDASFAPTRVVLPPALALAAPQARLVALIKPQFEAGRAAAKKGIVRDEAVHDAVCRAAEALVGSLRWRVLGVVPSPITGGDGNREFLLGARRDDDACRDG